MRRLSILAVAAMLTLGIAACGDDESTTVTETVPTEVVVPETTVEPTVTEETTTTTPGPGPNGGETADLPLCSQGPPPCRTADGTVEVP